MKNRFLKRKVLISAFIIIIIGISSIAIISQLILDGTEPDDHTDGDTNGTEPNDHTNGDTNGTEPNDHTNGDTNGENNNFTDIKIVGKEIPPGYVMGNPIDIELLSGIGALYIRNSEERISIRFTAQLSGEVSALTIYTLTPKGQPQVRIGLQEDVDGIPEGEWMNEYGFGIRDIPSNSSFITVNLQKPVTLSKDEVYHIVIEATVYNLGDEIPIRTYIGNTLAQPLNNEDPDIVWSDPMINTLSYSNEKWIEENKWPIFIVGYNDARQEGQPYSLEAPWVIYSSKYVGQTIIPASNYTIEKIAFVVGIKGEPSDKLYYEIRNSNNEVLSSGLFTDASQLSIRMKWIEVTLPSPVTFKAGELYRIILLSPETDLTNPYHIFGHEFIYNTNIGYGGLQHQLTSSSNAGVTWFENKDADAVFKLTNIE